MSKYIGLSDNRVRHSVGVARKAYAIAKEMGLSDQFAKKMFMIGAIHDIGYEFAPDQPSHPDISANLLANMFITDIEDEPAYNAVKDHGKVIADETIEWKILNMADMQVDSFGNEVTVQERLENIKERYGEHSPQYRTSLEICYETGLLEGRGGRDKRINNRKDKFIKGVYKELERRGVDVNDISRLISKTEFIETMDENPAFYIKKGVKKTADEIIIEAALR